MNNSFGGAGDLVAVTDRLESLNSVLGGIRTALFCADEKTEGLVEKCSSLERDLGALSAPSQEIELLREQLAELRLEVDRELEGKEGQGSDVSLRIEELNGLMDSIRSTITVELGAIRSRLGILESGSSVDKIELISGRLDRLQHDLESQSAIVEQQSLALKDVEGSSSIFAESGLSPEDILPQLDELRAHQETLESQVHGIGEAERAPWAQELHDRQGDHQVRLQKLEASKEGLGLRFEQLKSAQLDLGDECDRRLGELASSSSASVRDLEGRLTKGEHALGVLRTDIEELMAHQAKGETEALFLRLGELESVLLSVKTRLSGGVQLGLETMEGRLSDLELFQVSQDQRGHALESKLDALSGASVERDSSVEERLSTSSALLEGVQTSLSRMEAEVSACREKVDSQQLGEEAFAATAQLDLDDLRKIVKADHDRLEELGEQCSHIDDRIRQQMGLRDEELRNNLAVAQQSTDGERELVREELLKIKEGQEEVVSLKEELEGRRYENDELRSSLRRLNDDLFQLKSEGVRQKKVFFSGMAAALVMSVGLSTYMSRSAVPVLNEPTMALSAVEVPEVLELSAYKEAGWVPLEAPVIASPEEVAVDVPVDESAPAHLDVVPSNPGPSSYAIQVSPAVTMETNSGNKVNYTVQEGDSLWKIAKKHKGKIGVMERIEKIKRDNELNDANLKPGQLLSIYL